MRTFSKEMRCISKDTGNLHVSGNVLLKQMKRNKWSTAHEPAFYIVTQTHGTSIAAQRITDRQEVYRDASQFKISNALIQDNTSKEKDNRDEKPTSEDWREKILLSANLQSVQEEIITNTEETVETGSSDKMEQNKPSKIPTDVTRPRHDWRMTRLYERLCYQIVLSLWSPDIDTVPLEHFLFELRTLDI